MAQFAQNIKNLGGFIVQVNGVERQAYDEIVFAVVGNNNLIAIVYQGCVLNTPIVFPKGTFTGVKI